MRLNYFRIFFIFENFACQQGKPVERQVRENRRSTKMIWLAGRKTDYLRFDGLQSVKLTAATAKAIEKPALKVTDGAFHGIEWPDEAQ